MPILTTLRLEACSLSVGSAIVPVADHHGNVVHDAKGNPQTRNQTTLIFADPVTYTQIVVPLTDEAKHELVKALTGGIVLANGSGVN